MKSYNVRGSTPPTENKPHAWRNNKSYLVIANTLQKAIDIVVTKHPDIELHSAIYHGESLMGVAD